MLDCAAAEGEDHVLAAQELRRDFMFQRTERGFAIGRENLPDRPAGAALDDQVSIDERQSQLLGQQVSHCGLARAHESDQNNHRGMPGLSARLAVTSSLSRHPGTIPAR